MLITGFNNDLLKLLLPLLEPPLLLRLLVLIIVLVQGIGFRFDGSGFMV